MTCQSYHPYCPNNPYALGSCPIVCRVAKTGGIAKGGCDATQALRGSTKRAKARDVWVIPFAASYFSTVLKRAKIQSHVWYRVFVVQTKEDGAENARVVLHSMVTDGRFLAQRRSQHFLQRSFRMGDQNKYCCCRGRGWTLVTRRWCATSIQQ